MSSAKVETPVVAQATSPSGPDSYELANVGKEDRSVANDSSKADDEDKSLYQTPAQIRIERIRFATLLYSFFLLGWNDGSTGPLLPAIKGHYSPPRKLSSVRSIAYPERPIFLHLVLALISHITVLKSELNFRGGEYNVGFAAVSSLFIVTCAGAAVGAFSIFYLLDKLGFGKVLVIGAILQTIAYAVQAAAPPFPAFVVISFINGMGMSFQDATGNGFVASLKRNGARKMGILHAVYGLGAFVAPFVATPFSSMKAKQWALFYITSAGIAATAAVALSVVFRFKRQDVLLHETNSEIHKEEPSADGTVTVDGRNKMMHTLSLPLVHYLAFYIGVYVGVEVTLGGWVVTFIRDERGGNASSGYITSGFFGGLMAGRILLLPVNSWLGERRVIFLYAVLTIALDVVIWQVRSLIGDAVAVSIIGVLFGPMYPIVMHQAGLILPPRILAGAVGYIAGFGIVGAAIIPFITGALAARFEIRVMPIVVLIMTTMMAMLWALAMRQQKRSRID